MRFNGTIKAIKFQGERVSILLKDAHYFSKEGDWILYPEGLSEDHQKLIRSGDYRNGELWASSFEDHIIQAIRRFDEDDASQNIQKGSEVEMEVIKTKRGFLNMKSIGLKIPERDVNEDIKQDARGFPVEDMPPDMPENMLKPTGQETVEYEPRTPKRTKLSVYHVRQGNRNKCSIINTEGPIGNRGN
jgi:hypothetical protein